MSVHCDYQVFGLKIRSAMPLPELQASPSPAPADVLVEFGRLPADAPSNPGAHDHDGSVILIIDGVARFAITGGGHILIEPLEGARQANVRLYLLGSALGILLHQRGQLPLHANAVEIKGRAFAFVGRSGAGKSTLAALFHDMGHRILADDVCVVRFAADGQALAAAGIPRLRLWKETLLALGREPAAYEFSYAGDESWEKYDVPLDQVNVDEVPLGGIYVLDVGDRFDVTPLSGLEAAQVVFENTYRGRFVRSAGNPARHWAASLDLIAAVPIFRLTRRWDLSLIKQDAAALIEHISGRSD